MTNKSLRLRNVRLDELEALSRLIRDAYQQYQRGLPSDAWAAYLRDITDVRSRLDKAEVIVAELDGRLVGTITLYTDASEDRWPPGWASLRILAVHPAYRRRGIGQALMEECLRRCRKRGIALVGLRTTKAMDVGRRMYERMGFVRAPEFDFHPVPEVTVMAYSFRLAGA